MSCGQAICGEKQRGYEPLIKTMTMKGTMTRPMRMKQNKRNDNKNRNMNMARISLLTEKEQEH